MKKSTHQIFSRIIKKCLYLLVIFTFPTCENLSGSASENREDGVPHIAFQTWQHYLGDPGRTHYSKLDQIDTTNVAQLTIAWRYESGGLIAGQNSQIQTNPLIVDSILYGVNPQLDLFALNGRTGKVLWTFEPSRKYGGGVSRGLAYWASGAESRLFLVSGPYVYAVYTNSGKPVLSFGAEGKIDLREGLGRDAKRLAVSSNTPGTIYKDLLIMGTRVDEAPGSAPGHIRAYDVKSGEIVWTFHTIPQPGEAGYGTWPREAYTYIGGANSWAGMAVDLKRGLLFAPTGSAAFDFYGGNRAGDNLYANTLIAIDAATGERRWHYQFVRHDLWDRDLPAPPNLVTIERAGKRIPAVAQITKSGHVFLFHRETGEPLFPIEEKAYPSSQLPGEQTAKTQPLPLRPAPFARQRLTEDMLYAPEQQAMVNDFAGTVVSDGSLTVGEQFRKVTSDGQFIPADTNGVIVFPGFDGGAEWGGAAIDPRSGIMYVNSNEMAWILKMGKVEDTGDIQTMGKIAYQTHCVRCHGGALQGMSGIPGLTEVRYHLSSDSIRSIIRNGKGLMLPNPQLTDEELNALTAFLLGEEGSDPPILNSVAVPYIVEGFGRFQDARGLPAVEPPWGTLNAIDLNSGDYLWRVPFGNIEEVKDPDHPVTGAENYGGPVVTAGGLLFIAATKDEKIRAFHARSGKILWEAQLPAGGYATPATYEINGRQYLVIACGGGKMRTKPGDTYLVFALPN